MIEIVKNIVMQYLIKTNDVGLFSEEKQEERSSSTTYTEVLEESTSSKSFDGFRVVYETAVSIQEQVVCPQAKAALSDDDFKTLNRSLSLCKDIFQKAMSTENL